MNTSKFTSDEPASLAELPQAVPILNDDPSIVDDPIVIDVKAVALDDSSQVGGEFDNGADAVVANLLVYLHNYMP